MDKFEASNYDLVNIVTPIRVQVLERLLRESNYDEMETEFLVKGFKFGFELCYRGPTNRRQTARNLPLSCGTTEDLWNHMMKETKLKRFAGPCSQIPNNNYIQSPAGLILKQEPGQTHLIVHLSFPKNSSVIFYTPKELYDDLDSAIRLYIEAGSGCYVATSDLKSAFRQLPIGPDDWRWLIMKAKHPMSGKTYYFVNKCLAFGSSISCCHCQIFSNGLQWIFQHRSGRKANNYLDDF